MEAASHTWAADIPIGWSYCKSAKSVVYFLANEPPCEIIRLLVACYCCYSLPHLVHTLPPLFMAGVSVPRPAGPVVAVHPAIIVGAAVPAVFARHRKNQRKSPLKKAASARLPPKRVANAAEPPRQEAVIAGSMQNEWVILFPLPKSRSKKDNSCRTPFIYNPSLQAGGYAPYILPGFCPEIVEG